MFKFFYDRLREPSTWRGLVMIATGAGISMSPEQMNAIVAGGMVLVGIIGGATKDK